MTQQTQDAVICTHCVLDAARIFNDIYTAQSLQPESVNLYKGQPDELESVAPYLFTYEHQSPFAYWLKENGWGKSWGVFIETPVSMEDLFLHFRNFLYIKTPEGKDFFFRFYDPRVLRKLLLRYNPQELKAFFGPIQKFICEDEDGANALSFSFDGSKLSTETIAAKKVFKSSMPIGKNDASPGGKSDTPNEGVSVELKANKPARKFFE